MKKKVLQPVNKTHHFKINTPAFLKEIVEGSIATGKNGVLFVPLNVFRIYLGKIAERCTQLNDPILNQIMCDMAMYDQADPYSKEYNEAMVKQVQENYQAYLATNK